MENLWLLVAGNVAGRFATVVRAPVRPRQIMPAPG